MFGRERHNGPGWGERFGAWCRQRSGYALASGFLGIISLPDAVIVVPGVAAIVTGVLGLGHLRREPQLRGRRLCHLGIVCGSLSLLLATAVHTSRWWWPATPAPAAAPAQPSPAPAPAPATGGG
jgi:hypothetical protein